MPTAAASPQPAAFPAPPAFLDLIPSVVPELHVLPWTLDVLSTVYWVVAVTGTVAPWVAKEIANSGVGPPVVVPSDLVIWRVDLIGPDFEVKTDVCRE